VDQVTNEPTYQTEEGFAMSIRSTSTLLGAMAIALPSAALGQQFEGVVKQRTISVEMYALEDMGFDVSEAIFDVPIGRIMALREDLEAEGAMTVDETVIYIKSDLIRTDMTDEDGPSYATMDVEEGVVRLFQPTEEMYIEWSQQDMERMRAMTPGVALEQPEVNETGQTSTINGMTCIAYDVRTIEGATRVWVSTENANLTRSFVALGERLATMAMDEEQVDETLLVAQHGFPVVVQRLGYDVYEIEETVSVEAQSVSDDMFTPPPGYRKMTMADMMRRPE
jgi:hypothetical protein